MLSENERKKRGETYHLYDRILSAVCVRGKVDFDNPEVWHVITSLQMFMLQTLGIADDGHVVFPKNKPRPAPPADH